MKKLAILLSCILLLNISTFTVFSDDNSAYVPSIGYKHDIYVPDDPEGGTVVVTEDHSVIYRHEDDGCDVEIVVTPYAKKATIESDESRSEIQIAYDEVMAAESVCTMAPVMIDKIKGTGLVDEDLILSNIFDVTVYVREAGEHKPEYDHSRIYNIKVGAESLRNFVALLHYSYDPNTQIGVWEIVPDARVTGANRDTVTFSWVDGSPFAIVSYKDGALNKSGYTKVNTSTQGTTNTNTHKCIVCIGDTCYCWLVVILLIVSIFLNVYLILKKNEKR